MAQHRTRPTLTISTAAELKARLSALAQRLDLSVSEVAELALRAGLPHLTDKPAQDAGAE